MPFVSPSNLADARPAEAQSVWANWRLVLSQPTAHVLFWLGCGLFVAWSFALFYALVLRPLWLDELLHLQVASTPWSRFFATVTENPGGTPLTYLPQYFAVRLLDDPKLAGRLPSVLALLGAAYALRRILVDHAPRVAYVAIALLAAMPLVVRYATESRPYLALLLVSLVATWLFQHFQTKRTWLIALAYLLTGIVGVYTLPIFLAVPCWHAAFSLWGAVGEKDRQEWRRLVLATSTAAVAALSMVPWYLYAADAWKTTIVELSVTSTVSASTLLQILREITGAGYLGAAILVPLVAAGTRSSAISRNTRIFWLIGLVVPVCFVLAVDSLFGYFFAIRQLIVILPPLVVLAAFGLQSMWSVKPNAAGACLLLTLALLVGYSLRWATSSQEDWEMAALAGKGLQREAGSRLVGPGACIITKPRRVTELLAIAEPSVRSALCSSGENLKQRPALVIVDTGYGEAIPAYREMASTIEKDWRLYGQRKYGRMTITGYQRVSP